MAINVTDIGTYSDADILKVLRSALVDSVLAMSYSINGRSLGRASPEQIQKLIEIYEDRVAAANGGDILLARFGNPRS